ncbi:hypothetical protein CLOM_g1680 [Closterium sp. NIES-68]|nr:hypothetical protein CLOM_g1680 [Closterium sp. NIES-68]
MPEFQELRDQLDYLLAKGFVRLSTSPFAVPILFTPTKDGGLRICIDYRALHRVTIKSRYPIPRVDELIDQLRGARNFSKIDLHGGYHQIRVFADDCHKTAFCTRYGSYEYTVMSFGLTNAPSTFLRTMNGVFRDLIDKCVIIYLDDILIYNTTWKQHLKDLEAIFQRLTNIRVAKVTVCRAKLSCTRQRNAGDRARVQDLAMLPDRSRRDCMNRSQIPTVPASTADSQPESNFTYRIMYKKDIISDVQKYVGACPTCQTMKSSRQRLAGLLQPLKLPQQPWQHVIMDFVTSLPTGPSRNDAVLVVVDRLTKMAHFAPCRKTITSEETARLFISAVVCLHGIPKFTSRFWQDTWNRYGTRLQFLSAYHPQTDGQTEWTNQTMEHLIRTNYPEISKWEDLLPMLESSCNNAPSAMTNQSPFFVYYGMDPTVPISTTVESQVPCSQQFVDLHESHRIYPKSQSIA